MDDWVPVYVCKNRESSFVYHIYNMGIIAVASAGAMLESQPSSISTEIAKGHVGNIATAKRQQTSLIK